MNESFQSFSTCWALQIFGLRRVILQQYTDADAFLQTTKQQTTPAICLIEIATTNVWWLCHYRCQMRCHDKGGTRTPQNGSGLYHQPKSARVVGFTSGRRLYLENPCPGRCHLAAFAMEPRATRILPSLCTLC